MERYYEEREEGQVPNLPCGVERPLPFANVNILSGVPNLPCGVESYAFSRNS